MAYFILSRRKSSPSSSAAACDNAVDTWQLRDCSPELVNIFVKNSTQNLLKLSALVSTQNWLESP